MTSLQCGHCGGPVVLGVSLENIFGKIKIKLMANRVRLTYSGLIAKNVSAKAEDLMCQSCGRTLKDDKIKFRCDFTNKRGILSEFWLIKPAKGERRLRKLLMHESNLEKWEIDSKRDKIEFTKTRIKIEIERKEPKNA